MVLRYVCASCPAEVPGPCVDTVPFSRGTVLAPTDVAHEGIHHTADVAAAAWDAPDVDVAASTRPTRPACHERFRD